MVPQIKLVGHGAESEQGWPRAPGNWRRAWKKPGLVSPLVSRGEAEVRPMKAVMIVMVE